MEQSTTVPPSRRPTVSVHGRTLSLPAPRVARIVRGVLTRERRSASVSITFLGPRAMRSLNFRYLGHDRRTDVLAFPLAAPDGWLLGDVYICAEAARQEARVRGIPVREELTRLLVHGTLHVLGYDHPEGGGRMRCPMWRRQERYVRALA